MRSYTFLLVAAIELVTPNVFAEGKIRLAQSSNVTSCMMTCNAQAASCQTSCLVPGQSSSGATATTMNATANTSCVLNCSSTQLHVPD